MIKKIKFKIGKYYRQNKEFMLLFALPFTTVVGIPFTVAVIGALI